MPGYYARRLAAERLRACYEVAPSRVAQYLRAEIDFVLQKTSPEMRVLELGCGYGRVLEVLLPRVRAVAGIDTSLASLELAKRLLRGAGSLHLAAMDAACLGFRGGAFDLTLCIQNGICAFGSEPLQLCREAVRVTRPGGAVLVSSYSPRFWAERLGWFEAQAARGLVGPIDREATRPGVIACTDGFRSTTLGPEEFAAIAARLGLLPRIVEVDASSLFCELPLPAAGAAGH